MKQAGKPRGEDGQICPIRNVDCGAENGCQVCYFWLHMEGTDPVSGAKISGYDCLEHWKVKIGLHQIRIAGDGFTGVQAATESFRNEVVRTNQDACRLIAATALSRPTAINGGSVLAIEDSSS